MDCLVINGYGYDGIGLDIHRSLDSKMEDACREYQSSLEDLTYNSKPHINMLTILAEENLLFAKDIVAIIEAQISKAPPSEKLPVLYLVDSIVKNVGGEYVAVFAKNLVTSFICVFEKVDENTRKSLFKLRSTWDDVFPLKKLYALDVQVNTHDSAWPIKPIASIHVNPKFLKQSEESSPRPSTPQPPAPPPRPAPAVTEASLTQEQLIRQQLLAKQKQLLELQQKKIELELEQTKAQLAGGFVLTPAVPPVSPPVVPPAVPKAASQPPPVIRPWIPPQTETKPSTRDPRLNRAGPPAAPQPKEQPGGNKEGHGVGGPPHTPEKRLQEKTGRVDKTRPPKKDTTEEKPKSKSPSPMPKNTQGKKHPEAEGPKTAEAVKKDPRLRKRLQDKTGEAKEEELKEKKRCSDKKEREETSARASETPRSAKGKLLNGAVGKHDRDAFADKAEFKSGGNARTNARKRTRSRSRSRSPPSSSPKRKDRRSPKGRTRSTSSSPPPPLHKPCKARRAHTDEPQHGKASREERVAPKKSLSEPKRPKRPAEERHAEARDSHSPRAHSEARENKDAPHRWRSGWQENKHLKLSEDAHGKPSPQRHKLYNAPRPTTPRTPKHRLSVDDNLQIPEVLNSASKKDLLRRAHKRLESGEISQQYFLDMAHQLKQLFQYQEEKQQRSESWEGPGEDSGTQQTFPGKKKPLLATPPSPKPHPHDSMVDAELSYYEHKSKLRRTQVTHRPSGEEWEGEDSPEEGDPPGQAGKPGGGRGSTHPSTYKYSRPPRDRQGDRHSKEREDQPAQQPQGPMIEEYNHGKEFPTLKSLPGLRFRRRADPRESSEREWNSPLTERQRYEDREEHKSGYDAPRKYGAHPDPRQPDPRQPDPRRQERLPLPTAPAVHRSCPSPTGPEAPARHSPVSGYERERLSPLHQKDSAELSPIPRFESPNSEHSDDGPLNVDVPPAAHPPAPRSILKAVPHAGPLASAHQHGDSPGHTPPHDGGHPSSRYDGPGHMGPSRPPPPGRFEGGGPGRYDDSSRYDGPLHPGTGRFDGGGPPPHNAPDRFDGPGRYDGPPMSHGPMRGGDGMGRFDGPPHPQGSGRFDGPIGQQAPGRFDGQGPGPGHFDGPMQHFEGQRRFDNNMGPGPGPMGFQQQRPIRFDGPPNQMGPMRFDGPGPMRFDGPGPMRFDGPGQPGPRYDMPPRYDCPPGQQGPQRFVSPHNMQPPMRPVAPPVYDSPGPPQQNFNMANQRFPEPMNPQYSGGPLPFPAQQNIPQGGGNFGMQPAPPFNQPTAPPFNQPAAPPFYNAGAPQGGNMQQPVNMIPNLGQPFLPQNPVPFRQAGPQFNVPESHFGQVDVNNLLSKLISTGIIPGGTPPQPDPATPASTVSAAAPAAPPTTAAVAVVVEEEEEEEQEVEEDIPDLTSFVIDDMKQRYDSVVTKLYTGIQCYSCGMRFTASQTDVYADHLDWHYRLNRSEKDISRKITHRRWYYTLTDWIEFEEIADLEERAKSQFFEKVNEEVVQKSQEAAKEKEFQSVKATTDVVGESCEICQEAFEMYWEEEEEEWHLKNAIRVEGETYHPSCFEDYKNTSLFLDHTPSPNKVLTEHPLSAFVKTEPDEDQPVSCCATVKQEAAPEAVEVPTVKEEVEGAEEEATPASAIS
ncbi:pre-mRNA cleavage complex 2 protein Pcf11 isoform 2-T2 [Polymixia lowei]